MAKNKLPKIVVVIGPTASGKTALSLEIAKRFNGEIVSADSRQIYCGMDIGTAKPPTTFGLSKVVGGKAAPSENIFYSDGVRHHLIDIKNPDQDYSVGQYKKNALAAIKKILKAHRLPIIVGGTGLYVDAVVKNLDIPKVKENKKLRARLEKEIKTKGLGFVFKKLVELDPEAAYIVDPKNPRRVIRAMEVALSTGKPFTAQRKTGAPLFDFLQIGLKLSPKKLKEKIQKRTTQMIKNGLVEEVKKLVKKYGYTPKAFDAIGYREIISHLNGQTTLKEAGDLINKNTWHYAKRQMGWFTQHHFCDKSGAGLKRNPTILWFDFNLKSNQNKILKTVAEEKRD